MHVSCKHRPSLLIVERIEKNALITGASKPQLQCLELTAKRTDGTFSRPSAGPQNEDSTVKLLVILNSFQQTTQAQVDCGCIASRYLEISIHITSYKRPLVPCTPKPEISRVESGTDAVKHF